MQGLKKLPQSLRPAKRPASSPTRSDGRVVGSAVGRVVESDVGRVAGSDKRVAGSDKRVAGNNKRTAMQERRASLPSSHRAVPAIYRQLFGNDEYEDDGFVVDDIDHSDDMRRLAHHFAARNPAYEHEEEAVESTNDQIAVEEAYSALQGRKEDKSAIL